MCVCVCVLLILIVHINACSYILQQVPFILFFRFLHLYVNICLHYFFMFISHSCHDCVPVLIKLLHVFSQVSEQEMDHIIARSTHRDKMSKNRHSSHSQGLISLPTFTFDFPLLLFTLALQNFTG